MSMVLLASSARTASGTSVVSRDMGDVRAAVLLLDVTAAATEANDTLNVYIQSSVDGTVYDDFVSFTQVVGNGGVKQYIAHWSSNPTPSNAHRAPADASLAAGNIQQGWVGNTWRIKWVIVDPTGSNASFTFSLQARLVRQ